MTTNEDFDDRYVGFREHADVRERVTALEGNQTQVMAQLNRIEQGVNARTVVQPAAPAPQETAAALALHRTLDYLDKRGAPGSGAPSIVTAFAIIGALALGGGLVYLFIHH